MDIQARLRAKLTGEDKKKPKVATDAADIYAKLRTDSAPKSKDTASASVSAWSTPSSTWSSTLASGEASALPSKKRPRPGASAAPTAATSGPGADTTPNATAPADAAKPAKRPRKKLDVLGALSKLKKHLTHPKKFGKASALVQQLVQSELQAANSDAFLREAYIKLFTAVAKHIDAFDSAHHPLIRLWEFQAVTHNLLFTDDAYQFGRAAAKALKVVENTPTGSDTHATAVRAAIIDCLGTMYKWFKRPWAKAGVNRIFDAASSKRLAFSKDQREQLDTWYNTIIARRHGTQGGAGVGGGILAPSGASSHRQLNRVGVFHPLFNRPARGPSATAATSKS